MDMMGYTKVSLSFKFSSDAVGQENQKARVFEWRWGNTAASHRGM